jgi:hypothetical protein
VLHVSQPRIVGDQLKLTAQLGDDFLEPFGLKDIGRFAQGTERGPAATELLLHFFQFAGLLNRAKRADDGIEKHQQDEHAILVHVELAIAGLVALTANFMQPLEQRLQFVKVFQTRNVFVADFFAFFSSHARMMRAGKNRAIPPSRGVQTMSNNRAEQD